MTRNRKLQLLPHALLLAATAAATVPAGMTVLQESAAPTPTLPTPDTLREQGVHAGQVDRGVNLHEQPLRLTHVQVLREATGDSPGLVTFRADIAVADIINLNWRYYPRSAYEAANARALRDMADGKLTALAEHPGWEDGYKGRLDQIAARWTKLGIEDREIEWPPASGQMVTKPVVWGEGVFITGHAGQTIQNLLKDGVYVGISTNGYSGVKWTAVKDLPIPDPTGLLDPDTEIPVTQDDFTYLTIDFVALPANSIGQAHREHASFAPLPQPNRESATPPRPAPDKVPVNPPPLTPGQTPGKETYMHPKLKALCEKLGKTLEQVKAENNTEYLAALEEIAGEQTTLHTEAARVPGMTAEISRLQQEGQAKDARIQELERTAVRVVREKMVDDAIRAANFPEIAPYQDGDTTVDLAKEFRDGLVERAVAAADDGAAQALVNRDVASRGHLLGQRPQAPKTPNPAPDLPNLNLDEPVVGQESTQPIHNPLLSDLRS